MKNIIIFLTYCFCLALQNMGFAQEDSTLKQKKDTSTFLGQIGHFIKKKWQEGIYSLQHTPHFAEIDPEEQNKKKLAKDYQPFEGKIVRHIFITPYNFDEHFEESSHEHYFGKKALHLLHRKTREWVIKNDIYIKKNQPLNASIVLDNERYLRTLPYLADARIFLHSTNSQDSVDVYVASKDVFSLNIDISNFSNNKQQFTLSENNVLGGNQFMASEILIDKERKDKTGLKLDYKIRNIWGSFIDFSTSISNIDKNIITEKPEDKTIAFRLNKDLYSQFVSNFFDVYFERNQSHYQYPIDDDIKHVFKSLDYTLNHIDVFVGRNLFASRSKPHLQMTDKHVVSVRYDHYFFKTKPESPHQRLMELLNNRTALLLQYTYFKQSFYKSNYILGFGITEDVPKGSNLNITAGFTQREIYQRPYIGIHFDQYSQTQNNTILQYFIRGGSFFRNERLEDCNLLLGASIYSRLFSFNKIKLRNHFLINYAQQINPFLSEPLKLNNIFGLPQFEQDSIIGSRRISVKTESYIFLPYKLLGFSFAPFITADISSFLPSKHSKRSDDFYLMLGGGIRTRNENLSLGTIELRINYLPKIIAGEHQWKISIRSNLRFRYNTQYVQKPLVIQYNNDAYNNIF